MPKHICGKCGKSIVPKETGIVAIQMKDMEPVALWSADLDECSGCGWELVTRFGNAPYIDNSQFEPFHGQLAYARLNKTTFEFC